MTTVHVEKSDKVTITREGEYSTEMKMEKIKLIAEIKKCFEERIEEKLKERKNNEQ